MEYIGKKGNVGVIRLTDEEVKLMARGTPGFKESDHAEMCAKGQIIADRVGVLCEMWDKNDRNITSLLPSNYRNNIDWRTHGDW